MKQLRLNINAETVSEILLAASEIIISIAQDSAGGIKNLNALGYTTHGVEYDYDISDVADDEDVSLANRGKE